jgi:transcriptional regulator with XRE-family HTH domain
VEVKPDDPIEREVQLGAVLADLIDNRGYRRNRGKICEAARISQAALSQYMSGRTRPSFDVLIRLAEFFKVSLDYLVYGEQRRSEAAVDYGPVVKYVDVSLSRLQETTQRHSHVVSRVGAILSEQIDNAVRTAVGVNSGYGAGLLADDETLLLESFSDETRLISMNLQYDVIELPDSAHGAAGRFLPIVADNIARGRSYKFLLPAQLDVNWASLVEKLRNILGGMTDPQSVTTRCNFRVCDNPIFTGTGIYRLDRAALRVEQPNLYETVSSFIDEDGWLAYSIPPSDRLLADAVQDLRHLKNSRVQFETIWRRSIAIESLSCTG